jgi:chromosome partitioning protein
MKRVIFNQKGGVGKTSLTCNLAAAVSQLGRKVLVIDLDSQANATQYLLGREANEVARSIADFFSSTLSFKLFKDTLKECVYSTPHENLWIIPSEGSLSELQPKLEARYKIFKLREALDTLIETEGFTDVFIDTPPALNFYTMSALIASDKVLIPFDCDAFSADALNKVMAVVQEVSSDHQPKLEIEGIIINQFQSQAKLPGEGVAALLQKGYKVLTPYLSSSIAMRESHAAHIPLVIFKPKHKLSEEFIALASHLNTSSTADPGTITSQEKDPPDLTR